MILEGHLSLSAERRTTGQTFLASQAFRAPFHLSKPYWDGSTLLVHVVNPTAGVLAGDRLASSVSVGAGAALLVATPSATRLFRMQGGSARCEQRFRVAAGGAFEYWPEPLVPHADSRYHQSTEVDVSPDGELVYSDFLIPGRVARGERWAWARLTLELSVRVGHTLVLRERLDAGGGELRQLAELVGAGDGAAFGNTVLVSRALEEEAVWRPAIEALHGPTRWVGVSRLRGSVPAYSLRVICRDGQDLRDVHRRAREVLAQRIPSLSCDPRKL